MSDVHEHPNAAPSSGYGAPGRSNRPLLFLIPIGLGIALALGLFVMGLPYLTSVPSSAAGEANITQTAVPAPAAGHTS